MTSRVSQPAMTGWGVQGQSHMLNTTPTQDYNYNYAADEGMTKSLIEQAADMHKTLYEVPPGVLKMFPIVFLLFSLAMFVVPITLVTYVGGDPTARQWFSHITSVVWILPILYIITYVVHLSKKTHSRLFITLSLIGSCLILLIVSNTILMEAYVIAPMLAASSDCMSWGPKREMQVEWDSAKAFYVTCMSKMATDKKITFEAAVNTYSILECPTYNAEVEQHPSWAYLAHLEATQWCGGWCKSAPAMWSNEPVQDACAPVVAQIVNDKVMWCLKQVCFYTAISLVVISAVLLSMPRVLRDYGIDWYA